VGGPRLDADLFLFLLSKEMERMMCRVAHSPTPTEIPEVLASKVRDKPIWKVSDLASEITGSGKGR
jgi:hypothetical protein